MPPLAHEATIFFTATPVAPKIAIITPVSPFDALVVTVAEVELDDILM